MVYTSPSRACKRCRQMKKRCDQTRPRCTRCINARIQCYGYRDEVDLLYHNQRSRCIAPKTTVRTSGSMITPVRTGTIQRALVFAYYQDGLSPRLPRQTPPVAHDIISFFFAQFVKPATSCRWPGWNSYLPEQYAAASDNACFKPALLAASYAILCRKTNSERYQYKAREFYANILEATSRALKK